jgi:hypothetical protein
MNEEQVRQLIDEYIEQHQLDRQTDELRAQIQELESQLGVNRLELAEEQVETYVRQHGLTYEAALDMVIAELEEKEQKRKHKEDERARQRTQVELEELGEA